MLSNYQVILNWRDGKKGKSRYLRTDGIDLCSYSLIIGIKEKVPIGCPIVGIYRLVVIDYTGEYFQSQTTSCHVNLAKKVADVVLQPLTTCRPRGHKFK